MSYEGKEYELQVNYWKPEKAREYGHTEYEIDGIRLYDPVSEDAQLLYTCEPDRYAENTDIISFLGKEYDISQYLTFDLPEGLTMTSYKMGMNTIWDGCMFAGEFEEQPHGSSCPESWYAPGGVGMLKVSGKTSYTINDMASFENGRLTEIHWLLNHGGRETEGEYLEDCDRQAMLYEYSFDVFTAPEIEEYQQKYGLKEGELQATARYWYVFFAEPDSEVIYTVFLKQQYFTKDDVIELARSVKFVQ